MSVYRRVSSAPAGSPPSDTAESQDAVQARRERKSKYYQKSRILLPETQTPVPQTSRRLFLKKQNKDLLQYRISLCLVITCKCCFDRSYFCGSESTVCCGLTGVFLRVFDMCLMRWYLLSWFRSFSFLLEMHLWFSQSKALAQDPTWTHLFLVDK